MKGNMPEAVNPEASQYPPKPEVPVNYRSALVAVVGLAITQALAISACGSDPETSRYGVSASGESHVLTEKDIDGVVLYYGSPETVEYAKRAGFEKYIEEQNFGFSSFGERRSLDSNSSSGDIFSTAHYLVYKGHEYFVTQFLYEGKNIWVPVRFEGGKGVYLDNILNDPLDLAELVRIIESSSSNITATTPPTPVGLMANQHIEQSGFVPEGAVEALANALDAVSLGQSPESILNIPNKEYIPETIRLWEPEIRRISLAMQVPIKLIIGVIQAETAGRVLLGNNGYKVRGLTQFYGPTEERMISTYIDYRTYDTNGNVVTFRDIAHELGFSDEDIANGVNNSRFAIFMSAMYLKTDCSMFTGNQQAGIYSGLLNFDTDTLLHIAGNYNSGPKTTNRVKVFRSKSTDISTLVGGTNEYEGTPNSQTDHYIAIVSAVMGTLDGTRELTSAEIEYLMRTRLLNNVPDYSTTRLKEIEAEYPSESKLYQIYIANSEQQLRNVVSAGGESLSEQNIRIKAKEQIDYYFRILSQISKKDSYKPHTDAENYSKVTRDSIRKDIQARIRASEGYRYLTKEELDRQVEQEFARLNPEEAKREAYKERVARRVAFARGERRGNSPGSRQNRG